MKHDETLTQEKPSINKPKKNSCDWSVYFSITLIIFLFFALLISFFFFHFGVYKADIVLYNHRMIKTSIDERKYRVIRLANNLEVLLVSDPNTSTCAASMAVGVGSYHDSDIYGLAHFFEHMLFLGSKSYPSPNIFSNHLSSHFGSTNAFTEDQKTVYYFDIAKQGFDPALMIFSRIFAEPLFDISLMNKEIDAVNSEHEKNINQDNWRQMQLIKQLSNPNHPFSKFSTGSHKTLRSVNQTVLHKRILEFYDKYYTPSNMKLTVLGHQNIEVLQDMVTKIFSDIRKDLPKERNLMTYGKVPSKENPFFKSNLGKIIWFKKITSTITLDLVFNIEELITKYRTKPENYFAYLMKYEGLNSLVSLLKEKNYATKIGSDSITYSTQFSQFAISLSLTDIGLKNVKEVIGLAFFYINKIKENGVNNEIFNETKNINEIKFKFLEKKSRYGSYMSSLSSNMFDYDYQDIMYGDYRQNHLNQTVIMDFLNSLSVENSLIFIGSKNRLEHNIEKDLFGANPVEKTENWYGTKYMEHSFNEQILNNFPFNKTESSLLSLRLKNHFITNEKSSLYCEGREQCYDFSHVIIPNLFYEDKHMKIYAKLDKTFKVPRTEFSLQYYIKSTRTNPRDFLMLKLFFNYLNYELKNKLVEAIEAGNVFRMSLDNNGINFSVQSYSDLTNKIFKIIVDNFYKLEFNRKTFLQIHELTSKQLNEFETLPPYKKYYAYFEKMMKPNTTLNSELLPIIESVTFKDFKKAISIIRNENYINALFYGHVKTHSLESIKNDLLNNIKSSNHQGNSKTLVNRFNKVYKLESSYLYRFNNKLQSELNHFIANFYQIGVRDIRNHLITSLLELSWGKTFYYELRTVKQYGYIVNGGKRIFDNIMYYRIIIQGTKKTPEFLDGEIDRVIQLLRGKVMNLKESLLVTYKNSLKNQILKPEDNLSQRFNKLWYEIESNTFEFDRKAQLLKELDTITLSELKSAFDLIFYKSPKKLSLQMYAGKYNIPSQLYNGQKYGLNHSLKSTVMKGLDDLHRNKLLVTNKMITKRNRISRLR